MSRIVAKKYDDVIGCSKVLSEGIEQGKILFLYVLFSFFESTLLNVLILTNDNINFCCIIFIIWYMPIVKDDLPILSWFKDRMIQILNIEISRTHRFY